MICSRSQVNREWSDRRSCGKPGLPMAPRCLLVATPGKGTSTALFSIGALAALLRSPHRRRGEGELVRHVRLSLCCLTKGPSLRLES